MLVVSSIWLVRKLTAADDHNLQSLVEVGVKMVGAGQVFRVGVQELSGKVTHRRGRGAGMCGRCSPVLRVSFLETEATLDIVTLFSQTNWLMGAEIDDHMAMI